MTDDFEFLQKRTQVLNEVRDAVCERLRMRAEKQTMAKPTLPPPPSPPYPPPPPISLPPPFPPLLFCKRPSGPTAMVG